MTTRATQPTLFGGVRMEIGESIALTVDSLRSYLPRYPHVAVAYSGGKDSTALVTLVAHLIRRRDVPRPVRLTVCYADTRMELPPLAGAALAILGRLAADGVETRVVRAPIDRRFLVYMLGRGVPPPNNATLRWCTRQIKVEPMAAELRRLAGEGGAGKVLMLTGVRVGESAARDARIALSCGRNGSECGQGWFQETLSGDTCDTLAPLLHWRSCLVWDWLTGSLDPEWRHGYPETRLVADAYDAADGTPADIAARTGCVGCPLAGEDLALDRLLRRPKWAYLSPLRRLRPLYAWLREPDQRHRMPGGERRQDGSLARGQNRMGPLTLEARRAALGAILGIQSECNAARPPDLPAVDMLDGEEVARIVELIAANTYPRKWTGTEPVASEPHDSWSADGRVQPSFLAGGGPAS
jgi:DNA sulfur modification protein DndC